MPNSMQIHFAILDLLLRDREEEDGWTDGHEKTKSTFLQLLWQACWNINITN
jgi:hypothetical protein